jgi:hypothetical protein
MNANNARIKRANNELCALCNSFHNDNNNVSQRQIERAIVTLRDALKRDETLHEIACDCDTLLHVIERCAFDDLTIDIVSIVTTSTRFAINDV